MPLQDRYGTAATQSWQGANQEKNGNRRAMLYYKHSRPTEGNKNREPDYQT